MGDRRRHQRFVMADACEGTFQLLEDVTIEEVSEGELKLMSVTPARPGEIVSVEVPGEDGNGNAVFQRAGCGEPPSDDRWNAPPCRGREDDHEWSRT